MWQGPRWNGGKEHNRFGVGKERYATLCAECEDSKMNRTRLSDHHVLCQVKLVSALIKRRESEWVRRIRSERLREHQYREGFARFHESKRGEWDEGRNVEQM